MDYSIGILRHMLQRLAFNDNQIANYAVARRTEHQNVVLTYLQALSSLTAYCKQLYSLQAKSSLAIHNIWSALHKPNTHPKTEMEDIV